MTQKPTIGRTVHYRLTSDDAGSTNERRRHARANLQKMRDEQPGFQAHVGNNVVGGEVVAMTITQVWPGDLVNGQAILDGNDSLWVTSAPQGDEAGQWNWPPRESE